MNIVVSPISDLKSDLYRTLISTFWPVMKYILNLVLRAFFVRHYAPEFILRGLQIRPIVGTTFVGAAEATLLEEGFYHIKDIGVVYLQVVKPESLHYNSEKYGLITHSSSYYLWTSKKSSARLVQSAEVKNKTVKREVQIIASATVRAEVEKILVWYRSKEWFEERGIRHTYGALLYGPPGGGKTTMVHSISDKSGLTVGILDLTSAKKFQESAEKTKVYGIWLIEDIDTIFRGRENISGSPDPLDFGTLLNTIQDHTIKGTKLLFITTNHPEHIDPALANFNGGDVVVRPGRIDVAIYVGPLDEDARLEVVKKTIPDRPDLWQEIVTAGEGETIALFQARCTRIALDLFWEKS